MTTRQERENWRPPVPAAVKAAIAGARGKNAEPLNAAQRANRYEQQTGTRGLTPAQARRTRKKNNRALGGAR